MMASNKLLSRAKTRDRYELRVWNGPGSRSRVYPTPATSLMTKSGKPDLVSRDKVKLIGATRIKANEKEPQCL